MNGQHFRVGSGFPVTWNPDFGFWQLPLQKKWGRLHLWSQNCGVPCARSLAAVHRQPVVTPLPVGGALACPLLSESFPTQPARAGGLSAHIPTISCS